MLFGFIVLIVALIFSVAAYYGGFKKIDLSIDVQGGELLIFKSKTGDYKNSGKVMDEIYESLIKDFDITSYKGFGTYYDNPREVKRELLRYDAGCIIGKQDSSTIIKLKERFEVAECPKKRYLIAEFPYKGKISVIMGVIKVYPAITKYLSNQGLPLNGSVMEIYDIPCKKIIYRKELN
ncbi:MAG: hypothetical protein A2X19_00080 [Bacteroidetes bacterium GWE2_39_28]|nr:MAG: hypothetical protein A2X19_00080 [Bacteroidetes bacterium GWE2_39_28]OFY14393.1 MAG: hypothetical protein A2X16_05340 [Bacteroidetes bacterium GWF2_39_10]OFZ10325.1 MAG: hypothetical protein A2465_03340 [Bacteroidetes bacterium RIFOXYC2_FULL_39_11]